MEKDLVKPWGNRIDAPEGSIVADSYAKFTQLVESWACGLPDGTLLVIGSPGAGKTETALKSIRKQAGRHLYLKGRATQYAVYQQLYEHIDEPVILDDLDEMLADSSVTALLKMLLETRTPKVIQWSSARTMSEKSDLPPAFETRSRCLLLVNELKLVSKNFAAVLDRALPVSFNPTPRELAAYVATWFDLRSHKDVYDYVTERLPYAQSPSCRFYVRALALKQAKLDWQETVDAQTTPQDKKVAALKVVLLNSKLKTRKDQYESWRQATGASEQAFYAYLRAIGMQTGERSERGKAISAAMKKKHAARKKASA